MRELTPLLFVAALGATLVGCTAGPETTEPHDPTAMLPCVPHESRCQSDRAMTVCSRDGLSREVRSCSGATVCLSDLPGARCQELPANSRSAGSNFDATFRLVTPRGFCSAFLINANSVVTNAHCCSTPGDCEGGGVTAQARYRGREAGQDSFEESFEIVDVQLRLPSLDAIVLTLDRDATRYGRVVFARGRAFLGSAVYVTGHPSGRPLESSLGLIYDYQDAITYQYASSAKTKEYQLLYGARAEPGSSGSPVFLGSTNAFVGLHHTGGLTPYDVGLSVEQTSGFDRLLGATDAEAIAQALEMHGIEFEELETE